MATDNNITIPATCEGFELRETTTPADRVDHARAVLAFMTIAADEAGGFDELGVRESTTLHALNAVRALLDAASAELRQGQ